MTDLLVDAGVEVLDERSAAFEAERAHSLGSTDSPAILGLSRRGSPLSVYTRLMGGVDRAATSLPAWIGNRIEDVVAELYTAATRRPTRYDNLYHVHPDIPYIGCHLDRRVVGEPIVVELKTRSRTVGWGPDGTGIVPPDIFCQAQHQMACLPAITAVHVAVLFGLGHDYRTYILLRDDEFIAALIPKLVEFWDRYVVPQVPPPAGGRDVDTAIVDAAESEPVILSATPEQAEIVELLRLASKVYAGADYELTAAKNRVKQLLHGADGIRGTFGLVTNKEQVGRVAYGAVVAEYHDAIESLIRAIASPGDPSVPLVVALARDALEHSAKRHTGDPFRTLRMEFAEED